MHTETKPEKAGTSTIDWYHISTPPDHNCGCLVALEDGDVAEAWYQDGKWKWSHDDQLGRIELFSIQYWAKMPEHPEA